MKRTLSTALFVLQAATVGLAIAFIATRLWPERFGTAAREPASEPRSESAGVRSYAPAVARAIPAVVNIDTRRVVTRQAEPSLGDPDLDRQAGISPYARRRLERSLGAGVIVRPDGYVLTNNHVVLGAEDIVVSLSDGRQLVARVVGTDFDTDLAVLKIDGERFPVADVRMDGELRVGDVVLAIGNPLGMGQTVTQGVVSAVGRNQQSVSAYEDFIQTDAAINVGSSGGALVDSEGELVGINTAMVGRAQGISFAIPSRAAMRVLDEIIAKGFVTRGWMGAEYTDAIRTGSGLQRGVAIVAVLRGSPAHEAGLLPGDVLVKFNDAEVEDENDLRGREASLKPGTQVQVEGLRAGVPFKLALSVIQRRIPGR